MTRAPLPPEAMAALLDDLPADVADMADALLHGASAETCVYLYMMLSGRAHADQLDLLVRLLRSEENP